LLIENEFTVVAPVDLLWSYLLDVERIAPCMPGAEPTEVVDDRKVAISPDSLDDTSDDLLVCTHGASLCP